MANPKAMNREFMDFQLFKLFLTCYKGPLRHYGESICTSLILPNLSPFDVSPC